MWKDLKLIHSFTLEASFCGASGGPLGGFHFSTNDFEVFPVFSHYVPSLIQLHHFVCFCV
jgi:hypothetical protein